MKIRETSNNFILNMIDHIFGDLMDRINAFEIDDPNSPFKFSDRLAKENMWTKEYALRVVDEYKAFMFLAVALSHPVTPSVAIDQCWHLHLLYTRNYEDFCKVLGRKIHHGPTKGGSEEDTKFENQYVKTWEARREMFNEVIPEDIWTSPYGQGEPVDIRYVNIATHWVVPTGDPKALFHLLKLEIKNKITCFLKSLSARFS